MFNYKKFKWDMESRGHEVHKNGSYITIVPDNNYNDYGCGFQRATDIVEGYEDDLKLVSMDHYNTTIYSAKFKVVE